jgi:hypothetical protein
MIVKDEETVIKSTLENICSKLNISYWVIADTGSTDNTINIIKCFFEERKIDGELLQHPWTNFGDNRTLALEAAFGKTDYAFIFDADDKIHGTPFIPAILEADKYKFQFEKDFTFKRPLLINNRIHWRFVGVLHEFLECDKSASSMEISGDYFIESGRTGNRIKNPRKYHDDAVILQNAFLTETNAGLRLRYAFYCAQSYSDASMQEDAIYWYAKTLKMDGRMEEKYCASLQLGNLHKDKYEKLCYWIKASEYDDERIEGAVNAMEMLYEDGLHLLVNALYHKHKNYTSHFRDKLFVMSDKYELKIEYYNSISAHYAGDKNSGLICCKRLLNSPMYRAITENNIKYYLSSIICLFLGYSDLSKEHYGSELAAIKLGEELATNNNTVFILTDQPYETRICNNVIYMNTRKFMEFNLTVDIMIVSRYIYYFLEYNRCQCKKLYIWVHDCTLHSAYNFASLENEGGNILKQNYERINGIVTLCDWHKQDFADFYKLCDNSKIHIIGNGIPSHIVPPNKIKHRFITTSSFDRGIETTVRLFHLIHARFPDTELHIFRDWIGYEQFVQDNKQYDYLVFHGFINNDQLQDEFAKADVWFYPTTFCETYCISALEAQYNSCLAICSNVAALKTTVGDHGLLLESLDDDYVLETVSNILQNEPKKEMLREAGRSWAQQQTWKNIADMWRGLFRDP